VTNSSSKASAPRSAAPPPAAARSGNAYTRFIPAEELSHFAAWRPSSIESAGQPRHAEPAEPAPAAPSATDWLAEVARARREGSQEGYQNGYRDGLVALESFKQSLAMQSTTQLATMMKNIEAEFDALQPQLAQTVAQVALELARQVLKSELVGRPEVVGEVATQALAAMLFSAKHITLAVHPQDVALVQAAAADALTAREARVVANAALARGDVMVHSDIGTIDARIATRWQQATAHLGQVKAIGAEDHPHDEAA
jgi:flagellar assembly protein FliH